MSVPPKSRTSVLFAGQPLLKQGNQLRNGSGQTSMRFHGRVQVLRECGHHLGRHRARPSDSQETILVRVRSISEFPVAKADLGSSARVVVRRGGAQRCRFGRESFRDPISRFQVPLMHQFRRDRERSQTRDSGCRPCRLRCNRYRHCASPLSALAHGVGGGIEVRSVRSDWRTRVRTQAASCG